MKTRDAATDECGESSRKAPPRAAARPRLSALDLGPAEESLRLGPELEAAGYHRHWIAEHQPQPLLVAALLAERTRRIRIGTAGILLHFYPPSRTAFDLRFLADRFPERIDAGFCRGRVGGELETDQLDGRDPRTHIARYPDRVAAFLTYPRNGTGTHHPPHPSAPRDDPEIWSLGSGKGSARLAAKHGLRFAYSLFHHGSGDGRASAAAYRGEFTAACGASAPYLAVAATGVCATTSRATSRIAAGYDSGYLRPNLVGTPEACLDELLTTVRPFEPDEVVFTALGRHLEERTEAFRLLADAWERA